MLATAIRAGMTVDELIDLDLAYSPPYGQAKDAVNLTGMVGENVLNGTLRLWYAQDLDQVLDEALILDVRRMTNGTPGICPTPCTSRTPNFESASTRCGSRRPVVRSG